MLQSQETNNSNKFSKQIRSRKHTQENSIQPFKSHRKRVDQNQVLMPIPQNQDPKNQQSQMYKLKRDYAQVPNETGKKTQRFKYDLNNLTQSITNEQISSKCLSNVNAFQSQTIVNRFNTSMKKNNNAIQNKLRYTRNEVKSILFDSNVEPFESRYSTTNTKQIQIQNDREIYVFKEKVDKVNNQIAAGINNLEKMIQKLKQRKINQSNLKSKAHQSHLQRLAEGRKNKQDAHLLQRKIEHLKESNNPAPSKFDRIEINNPISTQDKIESKQDSTIHLKKEAKLQESQQVNPASSQMPLAGDFKSKLAKFPAQYTSLINRLAYQIQIDMEFTNIIAELSKNGQLPKIKQLVLNDMKKYQCQIPLNESFFQIEASQIDPLQVNKPYFIIKMKQEQEVDLAIKVYKKYKEAQDHFETKLKQKFNMPIINLLFEQLAKFNSTKTTDDIKAVTIGHLLSYLNMRTNKSFRNRYFVKLAKRLQLKPSTNLNSDSFKKLIIVI